MTLSKKGEPAGHHRRVRLSRFNRFLLSWTSKPFAIWNAAASRRSHPPCRAACPLHVDARTLTGCIAAGDWAGAWRVLRRTMPLAPVLGRICDAPCETECKRTGAGGAIRIGALERACVQTPEPSAPRPLRPPDRDRSVAVCGSGLAGLTAAWDLARKGWRVEIFEPGGHLGAPLSGFDTELLPPQVVAAEAAAVGRLLRAVHLEADFGPSSAPADIRQRFDAAFLDLGVVDPGPWGGHR